MPSPALTVASVLTCPHQAMIVVTPRNGAAAADHALLLSTDDTFQIAGCPFAPGGKASPCTTIRWTVPPDRMKLEHGQVIAQTDVGLCYSPENAVQGPVVVQGGPPSRVMVP